MNWRAFWGTSLAVFLAVVLGLVLAALVISVAA